MGATGYDLRYQVLGQKPRVRIWPGPSTDLGLMAGGTLVSQGHTSSIMPVNVERGELSLLCLEAVVSGGLETIRF
jgi:hypothetical protein